MPDTSPPAVRGRLTLEFCSDEIRRDLSAAAFAGNHLWLASDEGTSLERLTDQGQGRFADHVRFDVADIFDLPGDGEIDFEGLCIDGDMLWAIGSHSLTRSKPKGDLAEALDRLADIDCAPNRYFLGRIPLTENGAALSGDGVACLKMNGKGGNALTNALKRDRHIAPHMDLPAKENGLDIEGLAARGEQVFLGLRGPVLRGWAMLIELRLRAGKRQLKLDDFEDGKPYRKHFVDLGGHGVRDLALDGDDLLILSGATMDMTAPATVWRWSGAMRCDGPQILTEDRLRKVCDLPGPAGGDKPEAIAPWQGALLVTHDSPLPTRLQEDPPRLTVDVYPLG